MVWDIGSVVLPVMRLPETIIKYPRWLSQELTEESMFQKESTGKGSMGGLRWVLVMFIYIYICAAFYIIIPLERIIYYSIQVLSSHIFFIALPSIQRQVSSGSFGSSRASAGGLRPSPAAFASSSSWPRCSANHVGTFVLWPACSKLRVGCGCQISGGARRPCGWGVIHPVRLAKMVYCRLLD